MGLEFARGNNSRCPSFLVGGLMVMCLFLACSWWSLSSQNFQLLQQIDNLGEQLSINGEELKKCLDEKVNLAEKVKGFQSGFTQQRIRIDQMRASEQDLKQKLQKQEDYLDEANKKADTGESALALCNTEMDSIKKLGESKDKTLESLRTENKALTARIAELEEKISTMKKLPLSDKNLKPIAKLMGEQIKERTGDKNDKEGQGPSVDGVGGVAVGGSHDSAAVLDENNAEEVKNDADPVIQAPENMEDDREKAMAASDVVAVIAILIRYHVHNFSFKTRKSKKNRNSRIEVPKPDGTES